MIYVSDTAASERAKYEAVWQFPEYHEFSPGLQNVDRFMEVMKPQLASSVIDVGCGACVAGLELKKRGMDVWYLDLTDAAVPEEVDHRRFIKAPIWSRWGWNKSLGWDYGFCCDVMEHVPPEYTMLCLDRILGCCRTTWFQISFVQETFGSLIGDRLHLTVQPFSWWRDRIGDLGKLVEARDLCGMGMFVVTR